MWQHEIDGDYCILTSQNTQEATSSGKLNKCDMAKSLELWYSGVPLRGACPGKYIEIFWGS